jgi:hypothetical protein
MDPVTIEIGNGISIVGGAGATAVIASIVAGFAKSRGWLTFQKPAKNGNGNGNGSKYNPELCRNLHNDLNISIKGLQDDCKSYGERLDKGEDKFNKIVDKLGDIQTNVGVLLDRSRQRRKEDFEA